MNGYRLGTELSNIRSPFYEIIASNFSLRLRAPSNCRVRLECLLLSDDEKSLIGRVVVANLAYFKKVLCRVTFNNWTTHIDVEAAYKGEAACDFDQFTFSINLPGANLESVTAYFCIRYEVNGREYWDNNDGANFEVAFQKKMLQPDDLPSVSPQPNTSNRSPLLAGGRRGGGGNWYKEIHSSGVTNNGNVYFGSLTALY